MAMHGMYSMCIMEGRKADKELIAKRDELKANKRGKKNLEEAQKKYAALEKTMSGQDDGGGDEEEEKTIDANITHSFYLCRCSDKRSENGLLIGGLLENPRFHRGINSKTIKKPKRIDEGKPIDARSLEYTQQEQKAGTKFKEMNLANSIKALD